MTVGGLGLDIVQHAHVRRIVDRFGSKLAERLLAPEELDAYQALLDGELRSRFLAKRFAAKEAAAKALGTGFRFGITLKDIVVRNDALGAPSIIFLGKAAERFAALRGESVWLSITDDAMQAAAVVVLSLAPSERS